jgi:TPR repeat protein
MALISQSVFLLGWLHHYGIVSDKISEEERYAKAAKQYEEAIAFGEIRAIHNLAILYHNGYIGKDLSIEARYAKAAKLYEEAIVKGDIRSINNLGLLYHYGYIGKDLSEEKRYAKAKKLYEESIDKGDIRSINNLGILYHDGHIGKDLPEEKRYAKAAELYKKGISQGNIDAIANLASLYHDGHIGKDLLLEERYATAAELYEQAIAKGSTFAMDKLARLYWQGHVGKDLSEEERYTKAAALCERAIKNGYTTAKPHLRVIYNKIASFYGRWKHMNEAKSIEYYNKAADMGDASAAEMIRIIRWPFFWRALINQIKRNDKNCQTVCLIGYPLTDKHTLKLTQALAVNTIITHVNLKYQRLSPAAVNSIVKMLKKNKTIQRIDITPRFKSTAPDTIIQMDEKAIRIINGVINPILQQRRGESATCKTLDLHHCDGDILYDTLLPQLTYYTALIVLNLSHLDEQNSFFFPVLTQYLSDGCVLETLDLSYNQLTGDALDKLSSVMDKNHSLSKINVTNNQITATLNDLNNWNKMFQKNESMKEINMSHNFLEESCAPLLNNPTALNHEEKYQINDKSLFYAKHQDKVIQSALNSNITLSAAAGTITWVVALACVKKGDSALLLLEGIRQSGQRFLLQGDIILDDNNNYSIRAQIFSVHDITHSC